MPIERSREPDTFTALEHEGWSRVIEDYQHLFGRLTQQAVEATLDASGIKAGDRLLDICTGHAILAAAAASRGAIVRGLDFSEAVLAVARRKAPGLVFDQGNAQELPYARELRCGRVWLWHHPRPRSGARPCGDTSRVEARRTHSAQRVGSASPHKRFWIALWFRAHPRPHRRALAPWSGHVPVRRRGKHVRRSGGLRFDDVKAMMLPQIWAFERADGFLDAIMR